MRSAQRDQAGVAIFGASVVDAASGSGVAQPGAIPFTFTRTATGTYQIGFDARLTGVTGVSNATTGSHSRMTVVGAGAATIVTEAPSGTLSNLNFRWQVTAIDRR